MSTRRPGLIALAGLTLLTASCGSSSTTPAANSGARTIEIDMYDIGFKPDHVNVHDGESIRFVFHNSGAISHDAYIGDEAAQMDHEMAMSSGAGMHHSGGDAITVEPGASGELTHTFHAGDHVVIGCHQRGHYAGGMKLAVDLG